MYYYLGIDHHKKYSQVAVMDQKGEICINSRFKNDRKSFESLQKHFDTPLKAVIEAGNNWGRMYDMLEEIGIDTEVAHPLKVRAIADAKIKTDSIDAPTLAHLLRANLIPEIHVPSKEVREQKNLLRHRLCLVRSRTMIKNRIYTILDRNDIPTEGKNVFSAKARKFLQDVPLKNDIDRKLLTDHYELLEILDQHIKKTESWIDEELKNNPYVSILDSIPGFAKILSCLATLEIDKIERFPHSNKFASYCCLVPSTYSSGGKTYHGDLIYQGNRFLKYVFIEAAWTSIRCSFYCRGYFERIKERKGSNVAIVALARRLSEIAYRCLMEKRNYEERHYVPYSK